MKANAAEVGRIVVSKQGHDAGRWYCVTAVLSSREVLCCDGRIRPLDKPKKKQIMHLTALPMTVDLTAPGGSGGRFTDGDLHKKLLAEKCEYEARTSWHPDGETGAADRQKEECALVEK